MDNEKRAGGLRGAWKRQSAAQQQAAEKRRLGPGAAGPESAAQRRHPGFYECRGIGTPAQNARYHWPSCRADAGLSWEPFSLNGMNAAWMRRKAPHKRRARHSILPRRRLHQRQPGYSRVLASKLTHVTGCDVLTFEYRLAPEHPYPAAVEDALRAWDHLMYLGYGAGTSPWWATARRESGAGALPTPARSGTYAAGGAGTHVSLDRYDCLRPFLH